MHAVTLHALDFLSNNRIRSLLAHGVANPTETKHVLEFLPSSWPIAFGAVVLATASWTGGPSFEAWVELIIRT